jgi:hypothetical protein
VGYYNHARADEIIARLGADAWKQYFTFCVERNPWDKTLSHYHMMRFHREGRLTFDQYLADGKFAVDYPQYTEPDDPSRLAVKRVLRYERLNEELGEVFAMLGIPFSGDLGVRAKSEYRTDRRAYRDVYNVRQAQIVERAFIREIQLFGYTF